MQLAARQKASMQKPRLALDYEGIDRKIDSLNFEQCERVIGWGLKQFYAVGKVLAKIKENEWYKTELGFSSFEKYCKERWGIGQGHAYRLIESAGVIDRLSPIGETSDDEESGFPVLPSTESQARELARLDSDEQIEAWQEVVDTYEPEEITAAKVAEVVHRRKETVPQAQKNNPFSIGKPKSREHHTTKQVVKAVKKIFSTNDLFAPLDLVEQENFIKELIRELERN